MKLKNTTNKALDLRKMTAALICGILGCVFMCSGNWLMIYGDTAYHREIYWLTESTAQMPADFENKLGDPDLMVVFTNTC